MAPKFQKLFNMCKFQLSKVNTMCDFFVILICIVYVSAPCGNIDFEFKYYVRALFLGGCLEVKVPIRLNIKLVGISNINVELVILI